MRSAHLALGSLVLLGLSACDPQPPALEPQTSVRTYRLPHLFEANLGQAEESVRFLLRRPSYTLLLGDGEMVITRAPEPQGPVSAGLQTVEEPTEGAAVRMTMVGAAPSEPLGQGSTRTVVRHVRGGSERMPDGGAVPSYAQVVYPGLYPGIDLVFYSRDDELRYDFDVAPGADPGDIRLRFEGADPDLDEEGNLVLETPAGRLVHSAPIGYQITAGGRVAVEVRFAVADDAIGFEVANRDVALPLVIDPSIIYEATLAGSALDLAYGVATDGAGHVYLVGNSSSPDFPVTIGGPHGAHDGFVARFDLTDPQNPQVEWVTYLGGSADDYARGVAAVGGDVYVSGHTHSNDFPTNAGSYLPDAGTGSGYLGFVAKLEASSGVVAAATYVGSSSLTGLGFSDLAVDPVGGAGYPPGVYVAGNAQSPGYATAGALHETYGGGSYDAVVVRLNLGLTSLDYLTYLGGAGADYGRSVAVWEGIAYVVGETESMDFPVTTGPDAVQTVPGAADPTLCVPGGMPEFECIDAFVAAVGPSGATSVYVSYLGGPDTDRAWGVAVDGSGRATVVGSWRSPPSGGGDGFVDRLEVDGQSFVHPRLRLGGSGGPSSVALDLTEHAHVVGSTYSAGLATSGAVQPARAGPADAFLATVDPTGLQSYFTYLGGSDYDSGGDVAVDDGGIYVLGHTYGGSTTSGAHDVFLVWIGAEPILMMDKADNTDPATVGQPFDYIVTLINSGSVAAPASTFTDEVPSSLTIQSVFPSGCTIDAALNRVECAVDAIAAGAGWFATIRVTPTAAGTFCNVAQLQVPWAAVPLEAEECTCVGSGTGTIEGSVSVAGEGLSSVTLAMSGPVGQSRITDANGDYRFSDVPGGTYTVTISDFPPDIAFSTTTVATMISGCGQTNVVNFMGSFIP